MELIGRIEARARLTALMRVSRVVALVGPPGIGKSALLRSVTSNARGAWWAPREPVPPPHESRLVIVDGVDGQEDAWRAHLTEYLRCVPQGRVVAAGARALTLPDEQSFFVNALPTEGPESEGTVRLATSAHPNLSWLEARRLAEATDGVPRALIDDSPPHAEWERRFRVLVAGLSVSQSRCLALLAHSECVWTVDELVALGRACGREIDVDDLEVLTERSLVCVDGLGARVLAPYRPSLRTITRELLDERTFARAHAASVARRAHDLVHAWPHVAPSARMRWRSSALAFERALDEVDTASERRHLAAALAHGSIDGWVRDPERLLRWLESPEASLGERLAAARLAIVQGDAVRARRAIERFPRTTHGSWEEERAALLVVLESKRAPLARVSSWGTAPGLERRRGAACLACGVERYRADEPESAAAWFLRGAAMYRLAEDDGYAAMCEANAAFMWVHAGRAREAIALLDAARPRLRAAEHAANADIAAACAHAELDELDFATTSLRRAIETTPSPATRASAFARLALIHLWRGERVPALEHAFTAESLVTCSDERPFYAPLVDLVVAVCALAVDVRDPLEVALGRLRGTRARWASCVAAIEAAREGSRARHATTFWEQRAIARALSSIATSRVSSVRVGADGSFVQHDERIDLRRHPPLQRVLRRLVEHHLRGRAATPESLVAAGWPGERMLAKAARERLHNAIYRLRNAGLRQALSRTEAGYVLSTDVIVDGGSIDGSSGAGSAVDSGGGGDSVDSGSLGPTSEPEREARRHGSRSR